MKKKPVITRNMLKSLIHMHASIMAPNFDLPGAPDESEGEDQFDSHYALQDSVRGFLNAGTAADAANRLRNAADQVDGHERGKTFDLAGWADVADDDGRNMPHRMLEAVIRLRLTMTSEPVEVGNWLRDAADFVERWKPELPSLSHD